MNEDRSVLRWGGLAGMLAPAVAIIGIGSQVLFAPTPPSGPCGRPCFVDASVASLPAVKAALTVGNAVYLAAIILWVVFFLALCRALLRGSSAPALFGSGLGLLGLVLLAAGGIPAVAFGHLSDVYHAPGATLQDQATLVLVAQGVQAIFNETDTVGGIMLTSGFILLGAAMTSDPAFGKRMGGVTVVLGLAALAGIATISIAQGNPNDPAFFIVVVFLPVLLGWKLYRLSGVAPALQRTA